jgi:superfamily II DNA or RNA helicase
MATIPCPATLAQDSRPPSAPAGLPTGWLDELPPAADCLYPHQRTQLAKLADAINRCIRRPLITAPTGAGKTHQIATIAAAATAAGLQTLILATRSRLVRQVRERLEAFGVPYGVRAAAVKGYTNLTAPVQICSADTIYRRCLVDCRAPLPDADVVCFDEAHLALGASRVAILDRYPHAYRIGFTATPAKVSGRSLAGQFDELITGPTTRELIALGKLVPPRIFNRPVVTRDELRQVSRDAKTNDFTASSLTTLMARPKLVGDVVSNWLRIAPGKRTLVFACTKAHGEQLVQEFRQAGVAAELLTDQTPEDEREAAIARLQAGETLLLVSCYLMSYGVDVPCVECISIARPTRSLVLYLQTVGRGLRPAPGKHACIVIDHGRCVETLGLPHEDFGWSLDPGRNVSTAAIAAHGRSHTAEKARECPECSHVWLASDEGPSCRACGWQYVPKAKPVSSTEADLAEMDSRPESVTPQSPEVIKFAEETLGHYVQHWPDRYLERPGKGKFYAWCKARERFKFATEEIPPHFWRLEPKQPSKATAGWLLHSRIKYAKRRCAQP